MFHINALKEYLPDVIKQTNAHIYSVFCHTLLITKIIIYKFMSYATTIKHTILSATN